MKQVFLGGDGQIEVLEAPVPGRLADALLVRNAFSLISSGTEGAAVTQRGGVLGLYEKARSSRDRVEQVWTMARTQGLGPTIRAVRGKLDDYGMIGYSSAGIVVEVDGDTLPFRAGDRVACMGAGLANHAEYVTIPRNLAARIPDGVPLEQAAFGALACIAMQGIRRLDLTPGERVGVIGLGLIGQICVRLLTAMGYGAVGIDRDPERTARCREAGVDAWTSQDVDSVGRVLDLTAGHGLDGVVVCAATRSDEPVNLAFDLCRRGGRVAMVGDVGLGLDRARMYRKELELRLSCSYGPGRYDSAYELGGQDYPIAHARWTEGRNLAFFLSLLGSGRLDLAPLASATFPVAEARAAYARLKRGGSATYGILLDYGAVPDEPQRPDARIVRLPAIARQPVGAERIRIGIIGVGGYAKGMHLPNLKALSDRFTIEGLASRSGGSAAAAAKRFGARLVASDHRALLDERDIDAVLISTRHSSHARVVLDALEAGKHVFVEKPMTTTVEDGLAVVERAESSGLVVRVGFNRRFSPFLVRLRDAVGHEGPRMLTVRANIGSAGDHWSDTDEEGGRLLGEGVHFLDICGWFAGFEPETVAAVMAGEDRLSNPSTMIQLAYPDGSAAQIVYTALGHKLMGKEYYEAFGNGRAGRCDDFASLTVHGARASAGAKRGDKGQVEVLAEFAAAIRGERAAGTGADARAGLMATALALGARRSAREQRVIAVRELLAAPAHEAAPTAAVPAV